MASAENLLPRAVSALPLNSEISPVDDGLSALVSVRPRLFGIGYPEMGRN